MKAGSTDRFVMANFAAKLAAKFATKFAAPGFNPRLRG
jgi:hypothetical protein